jgi:glycosyltransferase involved in cell wall biosynthesis
MTKPRVLLVGRTRYRLPLNQSLQRKFDALANEFELRVVGSAQPDSPPASPTFRLVKRKPGPLDSLLFYATLPALVAAELRSFRPDVVITQSVYEAAAVLVARSVSRSRARVVVEVHGDWDTAAELYGSRTRRAVAPLAAGISRYAVRRADGVRTVSDFTSSRVRREGVEPASIFPAFVDLSTFVDRAPVPLPDAPRALFVGVLERYKNVDGLTAAWRLAAPHLPEAQLVIVGDGRERATIERLVADLPAQTTWHARLEQPEIARQLDRSTVLVLPSRSEGLPRIVMEAFVRGRPVIGTRAGGIPDIVDDGVNGLLVPSEDPQALADSLVRVLSDPALQARLAEGARSSADGWMRTPAEYAAQMRELVGRVAGV